MKNFYKNGRKIRAVFYILCAMLLLLCANLFSDPPPPFKDSKIGFIYAIEEISAPPPVEKVFILPKQSLKIIDEDNHSVVLLARLENYSALCTIPKIARFTSVMERKGDGSEILFRGPVEAKTIALSISRGEELPVEAEHKDNFIVWIRRKGEVFLYQIPKKSAIRLERESRFAKFAKQKEAEGFLYLDNRWIRAEEAKKIIADREEKLRKSQRKIQDSIAGASQGFLILNDRTLIEGKIAVKDDKGLFFEDKTGKAAFYSFDELADMSFEEILAEGNLQLAANALNGLPSADFSTAGRIRKNCDQALAFLDKCPTAIPPEYKIRIDELANFAKEKISETEDFLKANNLGIYNYKVFPRELLDYHLKTGHILHGESSWIKPEQICKKCSGEGSIFCSDCGGFGRIREKCDACENGKVKCSICGGSGWKACLVCKGLGKFPRRCQRCSGTGYIPRIVPGRWFDDIEVIDGNVIIRTIPYPWCYYETIRSCPNCGGTGLVDIRCANCGGSGRVSCPITERCLKCGGAGFFQKLCLKCNGRGRIECPDCSGRGFTGEAQSMPEPEKKILPDGTKKEF